MSALTYAIPMLERNGAARNKNIKVIMTFIMKEVFMMNFGGFLFNPHYLHTLLHDAINSLRAPKDHYEYFFHNEGHYDLNRFSVQ